MKDLRDIDNERETIADETHGGIRAGGEYTPTLRFSREQLSANRRKPRPGLGEQRMNFGYDREMRLAAGPGRDAWLADRSSAFARIVPNSERGVR